MKTYVVRAVRDGEWWALYVDGRPNLVSQCRRLDEVEAQIRDATRFGDNLQDDEFEILVKAEAPKEVAGLIKKAREEQAEAVARTTQASQSIREAARSLLDSGLTMRDAAQLLGVSHQRVHQLVH